jgi:hypothetical protein
VARPAGDSATTPSHHGDKVKWTNTKRHARDTAERWPPRIMLAQRPPAHQVNLCFCHLRFSVLKADCGRGAVNVGEMAGTRLPSERLPHCLTFLV